ncbi:MAG: RNA polymerase sigma factor [Phycisphaerales bacterium]|nr:RNA polymerase sigma factor [Phycisphaerales bacterium]
MTRQPSDILSELLILNIQCGDDQALSELIEIWTPKLRSRAYRLTQDSDACHEVLQESWIGIARGLRSLRDPSMFGPWAFRIVHNKAANYINDRIQNRRNHLAACDARSQSSQNQIPDDAMGCSVREAISTLDPKLREVVYLFYMDNCTIEQLSAVLGIPTGTAKTRLKRARSQLKDLLTHHS